MAGFDDDTWDSVGATAIATTIIRADESHADAALFVDPYAQLFLDAAAQRGWQPPYSAERTAKPTGVDPAVGEWMQAMTNWAVCRTRFIDDFFAAAAARGVRQAVILAAGLDARVWRLPWHDGTVVYELDQPRVLEFKAETLRSHGVTARVEYVAVPIDLREDWPKALQENGFTPTAPTAWSVEGLLPYLSDAAQDALFNRIDALSAAGSAVAMDVYPPEFYDEDDIHGERANVAEWLVMHGWTTTVTAALDTMAQMGRPVAAGITTPTLNADFVTAERRP